MVLVQWLFVWAGAGSYIYSGGHMFPEVELGVERQQDVTLRIRAGRPGVQRPRAGKPQSFAGRHGGSETP